MLIPPILITIFNRPKNTAQVIDALRKIKPSRIFIHADGPRDGVYHDRALCEAARKEIRIDWECDVQWKISPSNIGCKKGMFDGISWFFEQVDAGIVLEDDCVPDPSFFVFCGELLEKYKDDYRVFGISGNNFIPTNNFAASYYFLKTTHIWGWATWRRSWQMVDLNASEWPELRKSRKLEQFLRDPQALEFWSHILDDLHFGQGNTWSGAVIYTMLKHDMLGIHPRSNLVSNYGFGTTGVHITPEDHKLSKLPVIPIDFPLVHPGFVSLSLDFDKYVKRIWELAPAEHEEGEREGLFQGPSMGDWVRRQAMVGNPVDPKAEQEMFPPEQNLVTHPVSEKSAHDEEAKIVHEPIVVAPNMGEMIRRQIQAVEAKLPNASHTSQKEQIQQGGQQAIPVPDLHTLLSLAHHEFVPAAYRAVLLREPDTAGLSYYNGRLTAGVSRTLILGQIALSGETEIARKFYSKLRVPYWSMQACKWPVLGWIGELVCAYYKFHTREFLVGDDQMFIEMAYFAVLGRPSDIEGTKHYLSKLEQGYSRLEVLVDLKLSCEGKRSTTRVAGLSVLAGLTRLRRLPIAKQIFDILALPSAVAEMLRHVRATNLAVNDIKVKHGSDLYALKSLLNTGDQLVGNLADQLNTFEVQVTERLNLISSALVNHTAQCDARGGAVSNELKHLQQMTAVGQAEQQAALLSLHQHFENIKTPILARIGLVENLQRDLLAQANRHVNGIKTSILDRIGLLENLQRDLLTQANRHVNGVKTSILARIGLIENLQRDLLAQVNRHAIDLQGLQRGISANQTAMFAELSASLPQLVDEIRVPLLARFTLVDRMHQQISLELDRHLVSLRALVMEECRRIGIVVPELVEDSRKSLQESLKQTDKSLEMLGNRLITELAESEARMKLETSSVNHLVLSKTAELVAAMNDAGVGIGAKLEQLKAESRGAHEVLGHNIYEMLGASVLRINEEGELLGRRIFEAISELSNSLSHAESLLTNQLEKVKADSSAAQDTLGRDLAEAVVRINQATQASAGALVDALECAETTFADQLREALSPLHASIPKTLESAHIAVDRLLPQLGRIELYSMTAARRVAIRCGTESVLVRTVVGYLLCSDSDHALIATLVETGDLEPGTRQLIQRLLGSGDIFVDVGANVGMHTLAAARAMGGQGTVIALEPHPQTSKLLAQSIWMNGFSNSVCVQAVAAAGTDGERSLHMGITSGHHSLFPLDTVDAVDIPAIKVRSVTLDQLIPQNVVATLIKIDAEGAELEIVKGAASLLMRSPDIGVIAEFGGSHLRRTGTATLAWLNEFTQLGFEYRAIRADTGELREITVEELDLTSSINLFFARSQSPLWQKAGVVK